MSNQGDSDGVTGINLSVQVIPYTYESTILHMIFNKKVKVPTFFFGRTLYYVAYKNLEYCDSALLFVSVTGALWIFTVVVVAA